MRLSLSWLLVFLVLIYIAFFITYGYKVYEEYLDLHTVEAFHNPINSILLTTCPHGEDDATTQMVSMIPSGSTQTYCYEGHVKRCSLSVPPESPTSCSTYYNQVLKLKGSSKCPISMPRYFQDLQYANNMDISVRGCTSGSITSDGKAPADSSSKCIIYNTQKDDLEKIDSCTNIKRLESAQCFSHTVDGVSKILKANTVGSPYVECKFSQTESVAKKTPVTTAVVAPPVAAPPVAASNVIGNIFKNPRGIAVYSAGTIYVADTNNHAIKKIVNGVVSTLAGGTQGYKEGIGAAAQFNTPYGVAVDSSGNVYVADSENRVIRKITPDGSVTTFAGTTTAGSVPGEPRILNYGEGGTFRDGPGTYAIFGTPSGIAIDSSGTLYVTDSGNGSIRTISSSGYVLTLAGAKLMNGYVQGERGFVNGTGRDAMFSYPLGIAVDNTGNVYVADAMNNAIRKITRGGSVTTLAGLGPSASGFVDGDSFTAKFSEPFSCAYYAGNLYVSDSSSAIRKISSDGSVITIAGGTPGFIDGKGKAAKFRAASAITVDSSGNLYAADFGNNAIRKITNESDVTTIPLKVKEGFGSELWNGVPLSQIPTSTLQTLSRVDVPGAFGFTAQYLEPAQELARRAAQEQAAQQAAAAQAEGQRAAAQRAALIAASEAEQAAQQASIQAAARQASYLSQQAAAEQQAALDRAALARVMTSYIPPAPAAAAASVIVQDIFTPESVTYTCNELESYKSWIDSIKILYPDMYAKSKQNLDSSETWSDDKKNTFCNILEQTKIDKTMTADKLKKLAVL